MKKTLQFWMLLVMALSIVSCNEDNDNSIPAADVPLNETLAANKLFSDIEENPDVLTMKKKSDGKLDYKSQYSMCFRQAVNHDQPDGETFQQRVCILFRGYDRPTILVTEGYLWDGFGDIEDLGINLNANMVHVEHRNFGNSFNQDKGQWKYQTCAQASADLHAVYQALKPIFKGKWMSAGTSKNGMTSMYYAYYYPNDMDLAAAFCSPFMLTLGDKNFGEYLLNEVGNEELRDLMKKSIRRAFENGEQGIYKNVCELAKNKDKQVPTFTEYVFNTFDTYFNILQYTHPNNHKARMETITLTNDNFAEAIFTTVLDNRDPDIYTYFVDCAKGMGFPDPGYGYFADLLEGTSFKAENVLPTELKEEDRFVVNQYNGSHTLDMTNHFFMNSTIPLLFYYSHDDPWSGGQPKKLGANAKKVINPIGIHSPKINDPDYCPAEVKKEVMDFVSNYIY